MTSVAGSSGGIGVFDSGVGGLTVVRRIWEKLPHEQVLFVADQAHVPYGGRPLPEVARFARSISAALIDFSDASAVVMACNVSTATALDTVRGDYPNTAVLGVIAPGARAALQCTSTSSIGVLATAGTVSTGAYTRMLELLDGEMGRRGDGETGRRGEGGGKRVRVVEVACPEFVPLIESELTESPQAFDAANRYLEPILRAGADVVILGCTHYPFLLPCLRAVAPHIQFIDPAEHTVCDLNEMLTARESNRNTSDRPVHTLYTTGDVEVFAQQIAFFLPQPSPAFVVEQAEWHRDRLLLDSA